MVGPDWDARWRNGALFGDAPTPWLRAVATRADFRARSALALADGDGRNGTWLAARGLAVTAVDLSAEASARAEARDRAAGVAVERVVADLLGWRPAPGRRWEAVALLYLQGPPALRLGALRLAAERCAPGGWLLLEGFAAPAAAEAAAGPADAALRWTMREARDAVPGFDLVEATEGLVRLDEGPRHQGLASVLRLAARRPSRGSLGDP